MSNIEHWLVYSKSPSTEEELCFPVTMHYAANVYRMGGYRVDGPFVPADQLAGTVEACLAQWVVAHGVKCGCQDPDTAGCEWPVPVPHTQVALDAALGGQ